MSRLITVCEAGQILAVSSARVYQMAREDIIPVVRMGRQLRIDNKALEEFIQSGGKALPGGWRKDAAS